MCGILFCKSSKPVDQIFDIIKYRGPDSTNILSNTSLDFWFCHHRLRIIQFSENLELGNQPIVRNGVILICNGEIYNYQEIARELSIIDLTVDCDIILRLYQAKGPASLSELDGDFAFIMYDTRNQLIITGRDHVGLKPLFIAYDSYDQAVGMCSSMKVLEKLDNVVRVIRHPIGEVLILTKVNLGMNITHKRILIDYELCCTQTFNLDVNQALQGIRDVLVRAVQKRILHTSVPYALLCSGGIDSSLILAICCRILNFHNIHVFTMKYDTGNSFDSMYADMLTRHFDIKNHTTVTFTTAEGIEILPEVIEKLETYDPNTIRASIPMYLLAKYIKQNSEFKVILSGEGADELFMGYDYFAVMHPSSEQAKEESVRLVQNLQTFDLLRAERCFSSHGLELRVPFLDRDVINYVLRLPGWMRLPFQGIEKWILREAFRDLQIPQRIANRQKERLSDGVGYGWVPSLINYTCTGDDLNTDQRIGQEKAYYRQIYDKIFKNDLIIRTMPTWSVNTKNEIMAY